MLLVFALLMSNTNYSVSSFVIYLGNEMDPSPYLLIFWHDVLVLALNIADTDM